MAPAAAMKPLQVLAWFLLVFVYGVLSADESVQLSESFGGPHGTEFSDQSSVAAGQTINSITVRAGERVDGVSLEVTAPTAATFSHGGTGGKENVLKLEAKEYITSMEAHWGEKKGRTRIFYLSFGTSAGHTVAGGSQTESKNTVMAPEGFQLGGFFGQDGEEIDKLGAIWTRISAEAPTETPAPAAPAPASGSEAPTESTAGSAASASEEDSAASDTLGSEAPKKKTPAKKKTINGSASEDTSTDGLADASGSGSEAPKKTTTVKKKTRVAASAASDEASAATSSDSFGSGAPTKKTPTKKKTSAKKKPAVADASAASEETSAEASTDASGSEALKMKTTVKKKSPATDTSASEDPSSPGSTSGSEAPKKKSIAKKKPVQADSSAGSEEASAIASEDTSTAESAFGSAEILKKKITAKRKRTQVDASATSEDDSAATSTDASGSDAPTKKKATAKKKTTPADVSASEDTSAAGPPSGSEAPKKKAASKKKATQADSSAGSEEASAVASEDTSTATSTDASGSEAPAKSSAQSDSGVSEETSASTSTEAAGSETKPTDKTAQSDASGLAEAPTPSGSAMVVAPGSAAASTDGSQVTAHVGDDSTAGSSPATGLVPVEPAPPVGMEVPPVPIMTVKDSIVLSESFGGPHGDDFSDKNFVNSGQKVTQLSIYAGKRLDGISLEISAPKSLTFTHGGTGGDRQILKLDDGEHVTSMEVHWGKKDDHTRIFYVNFLTSAGKSLAGGSMTDDKSTVTAPEGFQLAGFFGKSGKEIDTLGAIWAYIDLVTPAPTPVPAPTKLEDSPGTLAPEDIAGSLSEVKTKANKRPVQLSESFGGPHGEQFSDQLACSSGMTITSVTIRAGERLDGLTVQVSAPKEMTFTHGGTGGTENTITLEPGEYITTMEAHWGQKKGRTRIFYLVLGTNKGNTVAGGSQTNEKGSVTAPKGYQLAGFFGRYGDEIDLVGAVWSSIAQVNESNTPVAVSADEDIALGELFGGPHGNAYSDINSIKFGQKIGAITIRSDKRVDAVTLKVTSPVELVMNHGGTGGIEKTITLADDETITSMEAHWEKKGSHTRVFYISFTTSVGQIISGGTKTGKFGTATAPEGFVLAGFYGRAADEVDQIGAIWVRVTAKNIALTDPSGVGNDTYGTTIRNWVGPTIGKASDTACYRKSIDFDSNNICPLGYSKDGSDCAARCPLSYPISCGLECIPQNDDCVLAVLAKIGSVAAVALNAATGGVFGQIMVAYKITKWTVVCVRNIVEVIRGLIYYLRYRQTSAPIGDTAEMLNIAYQADVVLYDLPIAICTCLGLPVPKNAQFADYVLVTVEFIVKQAVTNGDEIISTGANVMNLLTGQGIANKTTTTVDELSDLVAKNSSCGWQLKRLTDRVTRAVLKYRNASIEVNDIRVKVYKSSIVLNDIPIVTNNCMGELLATKTRTAAYETRDLLRKTFGVIVDQLIETGKTDGGKDVAENDYMQTVANMGLAVLSAFDPTGIAYMASQFVQPICGPTAYVGEIDDGTLFDALGLTTADEAFIGSYGSYMHAGDGVIRLIFESVDTKDVTVVVHSGGDEYAKIDIGAGDVTSWEATFPELEDKTMYLDRWRPGLFGLPGKGGGSLLLWIPRSSEGGHITMHVRINPS